MSRYIDVDKAIPLISEFGKRYCMTVSNIINCKEIIAKIPTADVQEVRHGHWQEGNKRQSCSICRYRGCRSWSYCPNCGAKMDEEEKQK